MGIEYASSRFHSESRNVNHGLYALHLGAKHVSWDDVRGEYLLQTPPAFSQIDIFPRNQEGDNILYNV